MKKLTLIACAVGLVAGGLATVAQAGNIGSSGSVLAMEAVVSGTQAIPAPSLNYSFEGNIGDASNAKTLQIQYTLDSGSWNVGTGQVVTAVNTLSAVFTNTGATSLLNITDGATAAVVATNFTYTAFVDSTKKILTFNVSLPAGLVVLKPSITINSPAVLGTNKVAAKPLHTNTVG